MRKRRFHANVEGDNWDLITDGAEVVIRYNPGRQSSARPTLQTVGDFLKREAYSAQCQALLALICTLADSDAVEPREAVNAAE